MSSATENSPLFIPRACPFPQRRTTLYTDIGRCFLSNQVLGPSRSAVLCQFRLAVALSVPGPVPGRYYGYSCRGPKLENSPSIVQSSLLIKGCAVPWSRGRVVLISLARPYVCLSFSSPPPAEKKKWGRGGDRAMALAPRARISRHVQGACYAACPGPATAPPFGDLSLRACGVAIADSALAPIPPDSSC